MFHHDRDPYTGWDPEMYHRYEYPWHVDHIVELQVIGDAAEAVIQRTGRSTRGLQRRAIVAHLRDVAVNAPGANLLITCEKINSFKGMVFAQKLRGRHGITFADAVETCNNDFPTCQESAFCNSPVVVKLIERNGRRETIDDIVERMSQEIVRASARVADVATSLDFAPTLTLTDIASVRKIMDELAVNLESWGLN